MKFLELLTEIWSFIQDFCKYASWLLPFIIAWVVFINTLNGF